ncbi:hypothetical protein Syn7502_01889 [Synechococcus sp. PCC 7502]|nr:hypothetical protein Syn7502_01889 [Synechococcus sp. PCC 7502]
MHDAKNTLNKDGFDAFSGLNIRITIILVGEFCAKYK